MALIPGCGQRKWPGFRATSLKRVKCLRCLKCQRSQPCPQTALNSSSNTSITDGIVEDALFDQVALQAANLLEPEFGVARLGASV